jgi:hypothetical protein
MRPRVKDRIVFGIGLDSQQPVKKEDEKRSNWGIYPRNMKKKRPKVRKQLPSALTCERIIPPKKGKGSYDRKKERQKTPEKEL